MTHRERLLAVLEGRMPDRIPWIPRLKLWYEANRRCDTLPPEHRGLSLREVERDLFGGTAARDGVVFRSQMQGVEVKPHAIGPLETVTEYVTPVGTLSTRMRGTAELRRQGLPDVQVEFLLKRREDYAVAEYMVENTLVTPAFEEYEAYERQIGDEGYPMVHCGDCPFHEWMRGMAGYDQAFFHLCDFPAEVERLLAATADHCKTRIWPAMLDSPARLLTHGYHLSSQMTPPPLFERYIGPYYQELAPRLRARGKVLALHADNDTRLIFSQIQRAGFGMAECFATAPLVPTTLAEARAAWGDRVIIWGGVPSVLLEPPYTDEQFERYMDELFRTVAPGKAFILGIADNAMPGAQIARIRRITAMVATRGTCPIH